jgi:hypothetical protein
MISTGVPPHGCTYLPYISPYDLILELLLVSRCLAVFLVSPVAIVYKYMQEGKVMLAKLLKKATVSDQVHRRVEIRAERYPWG